jgi:hypothetical protein
MSTAREAVLLMVGDVGAFLAMNILEGGLPGVVYHITTAREATLVMSGVVDAYLAVRMLEGGAKNRWLR